MKTEFVTTKNQPQILEAEEAIISACINDHGLAVEAAEKLRPEHFYRTSNGKIFRCIANIIASGGEVDLMAVSTEIQTFEPSVAAALVLELARIANDIPMAVNVGYHAGRIRDKFVMRHLIAEAIKIQNSAYLERGNAADIVSEAQQGMLSVVDTMASGVSMNTRISDLTVRAFDRYSSIRGGSGTTGVPTGIIDLDSVTCGLQAADFIILAARPSMGKTALALSFAKNMAKNGIPVAIFSLEMSADQLVDRVVSSESGVNTLKFRSGMFSFDDWDSVKRACGTIHDLPIHIVDTPAMHYAAIAMEARRLVSRHGVKAIFVDYLQLARGDAANGRVEEVSSISREMKAMAKKLNIPVVALSQLSRKLEERSDKRPILSDLRESGALEQDADVVMFLYRPDVYARSDDASGIAEIEIAKHRSGPTGKIFLGWSPRTASFYNRAIDPASPVKPRKGWDR